MPRIIVTSRYLKSGTSGTRGNLVKYIATRETVEIYTSSQRGLPATDSQKELVEKLIEMFPTEKLSHEYEDYRSQPTKENASELISELLERNADLITDRQMLVKYISERPGVEKLGKHGLFTDECGEVDLTQVMKTIANHNGNIWSHVVSLKREDAERLGYITPQIWQELVKNSIAEIADAQNIPIDNIRWYAAFHNTAHHPHIHLLVYSVVPNQGYLTPKGIDMIRSEFANKIFANDLHEIYQNQTQVRDDLRAEAKRKMQELYSEIQNHIIDPQLEALIHKLSQHLQTAKGKKVYGYLQPQVKKTVDDIVVMLAADPAIKKMYDEWCRLEQEKYSTYTNAIKQFPPLHENKVFKPIKNSVINAVLEMSHTLSTAECEIKNEDPLPEPEIVEPESADISDENAEKPSSGKAKNTYTLAAIYRRAKKYLRGDGVYPDPEYAIKLFESCGKYKYAQYALGKIYLDGRYTMKDLELAEMYLQNAAKDQLDCAEYALGKLYLDETIKRYDIAEEYLNRASERGNVFAMYRLAKLYLSSDIPRNMEKAVELLQKAADKLSTASYALGKLYLFGKEVPQDKELAVYWLTRSADAGNEFAQRLLEHLDMFEQSRVQNAYMNMLLSLVRLLNENYSKTDRSVRMHIDQKRRAEIHRKKQALGIKEDHTIKQG